MILPSILEYTEEATISRFNQLKQLNPQTTFTDEWHIHVDIILPDFATERDVKASWNPLTTILMAQQLSDNLSIHIMGEHPETREMIKDLENSKLAPQTLLFLPLGVTADLPFQVGYWYDVDQWDEQLTIDSPSLLMTVKAGLSGQKAEDVKKEQAIALSRNTIHQVVLDGGWNIEENQDDLMLVSYGSFWSSTSPI